MHALTFLDQSFYNRAIFHRATQNHTQVMEEEILRLEATPDGSVEYTLHGENWRYDHAANPYTQPD